MRVAQPATLIVQTLSQSHFHILYLFVFVFFHSAGCGTRLPPPFDRDVDVLLAVVGNGLQKVSVLFAWSKQFRVALKSFRLGLMHVSTCNSHASLYLLYSLLSVRILCYGLALGTQLQPPDCDVDGRCLRIAARKCPLQTRGSGLHENVSSVKCTLQPKPNLS